MKRVLWTVGMGVAGLLLGVKGQDTPADTWWTVLSVVWAASVGYGIGYIFEQKLPTKRLVLCWTATVSLVGCFLGLLIGAGVQPYASGLERGLHAGLGALAGAFAGFLFGTMQQKRLRPREQDSNSGVPR
ncbi:MAG: hypothetical protein ACRD5K_12335 [Candidatus Acidiferrales bacterium]